MSEFLFILTVFFTRDLATYHKNLLCKSQTAGGPRGGMVPPDSFQNSAGCFLRARQFLLKSYLFFGFPSINNGYAPFPAGIPAGEGELLFPNTNAKGGLTHEPDDKKAPERRA